MEQWNRRIRIRRGRWYTSLKPFRINNLAWLSFYGRAFQKVFHAHLEGVEQWNSQTLAYKGPSKSTALASATTLEWINGVILNE